MHKIYGQYLLDKDLVIEINTFSLRKEHEQTMPGKKSLDIYKANGGKYVTIGSNAHVVEDIGADYVTEKRLLEEWGCKKLCINKERDI